MQTKIVSIELRKNRFFPSNSWVCINNKIIIFGGKSEEYCDLNGTYIIEIPQDSVIWFKTLLRRKYFTDITVFTDGEDDIKRRKHTNSFILKEGKKYLLEK